MIKIDTAISFFFLISFPLMAQQQALPGTASAPNDTSGFYRFAQEWMNFYNGPDAKKLIPLYSEDAEYLSSHVPGLVAHGRDRVIANFQKGMNAGGHIDAVQILSINISCELATLVCKYDANNRGQKVSGRNLLVLKKIDGKWLIITHMTVV